jgi:glycosyltransferase involved in cell wall biosynthesis
VLYVGRIAPEKRLDIALRAVAEARALCPLRFDIVGPLDNGRLVTELVALSRSLGIERDVRWWGQQSDPWDRVVPDTVLLTSDTEGLPRVLLEAQHRAVPSVATLVGGVPDIIRHGTNGLLSARGDAQDIGSNLARLALDSDELGRMSEAALARSPDFTVATMLDRYEAIYRELLGTSRAREDIAA